MDRDQVLKLLAHACERAGSQTAWAKEAGMSAAYVCDVLQERRAPGDKVLAALGIERVTVYRRKRTGRPMPKLRISGLTRNPIVKHAARLGLRPGGSST